MKHLGLRSALAAALLLVCVGLSRSASALIFPDPTVGVFALQYGDFYSYSLPVLDAFFPDPADPNFPLAPPDGPTLTGGDYYRVVSPGPNEDAIVIYTKLGREPDQPVSGVPDNPAGMDDAYTSVTGAGNTSFSTGAMTDPAPPYTGPGSSDPAFAGDSPDYWDAQLGALIAWLDDPDYTEHDLIFYFMNNQVNSTEVGFSEQNLFGWGQIIIEDTTGDALDPLYFDFTDVWTLNDPTLYSNATRGDGGGAGPQNDYTSPATPGDFVLSGGYVCFDAAGNLVPCDGSEALRLAHNLGENAAAYAIYSPEINADLRDWFATGYDIMRIDMRLEALNSGGEWLWMDRATLLPPPPPPPIPEPATMLLFGTGLIGLAAFGRKKFKK